MKKLIFSLLLSTGFFISNAQNHRLYGITEGGGEYGRGQIYMTDSVGHFLEAAYSFGPEWGRGPLDLLVETDTGVFYGTTASDGPNNVQSGVIFKYNANTKEYQSVHVFEPGLQRGYTPANGLVVGPDGMFYGCTLQGGIKNKGTIYQYDPVKDTVTHLYSFEEATGWNQRDRMLLVGDTVLMGATRSGGANFYGVIFRFNMPSRTYTKLVDFETSTGLLPYGEMIRTPAGRYFGVTTGGGDNQYGTIYEFDSVNNVVLAKVKFSATYGTDPLGGLTLGRNGKFYGITSDRGKYSRGTIYEYDYINGIYKVLRDFEVPDGDRPSGELVETASGVFYGVTSSAGMYSNGTVFRYDVSIDSFSVLEHYDDFYLGRKPTDGFVLSKNGLLYQLVGGGKYASQNGACLTIDPNVNKVEPVFYFGYSDEGTYPRQKLMKLKDGTILGTTAGGGRDGIGTIYEFHPDSRTIEKRTDIPFEAGSFLSCVLYEASNGLVYGFTYSYGSVYGGNVVSFDPKTNNITILDTLVNTEHGKNMQGSCIEADSGRLFFVTNTGGPGGFGCLVEYNYILDTLITRNDFSESTAGKYPQGSPALAPNGSIYGTTRRGGLYDDGTLYEYNPNTNQFLIRMTFSRSKTGAEPSGQLFCASNGLIYGTTTDGGNYSSGVFFEFNPVSRVYTIRGNFEYNFNEDVAVGQLMETTRGYIYGVCAGGGKEDDGVLYEYRPGTNSITRVFEFEKDVTGYRPYNGLIEVNGCRFKQIVNDNGLYARAYNVQYQWLDCDDGYKPIEGATGREFLPDKSGNYSCQIKTVDCTDTSDCMSYTWTGIDEIEQDAFKLSPNPGNGEYRIYPKNTGEQFTYQVTDPMGRMILHGQSSNSEYTSFRLSLPPGIYYVTMQMNGGSSTIMLIHQ